jgi:hypothetical protein
VPEFGEYSLIVAEYQNVAAGAVLEVVLNAVVAVGNAGQLRGNLLRFIK